MSFQILPRYVSGARNQIFLIEYRPKIERDRLVIVPPFADEMNRSRYMLSRTARLLASNGCTVFLPDLSGTGDSYGNFDDVSWTDWLGVPGWRGGRGTFDGLLAMPGLEKRDADAADTAGGLEEVMSCAACLAAIMAVPCVIACASVVAAGSSFSDTSASATPAMIWSRRRSSWMELGAGSTKLHLLTNSRSATM
jgi:hypothetical protein